jgi:putative tricarboxylic transport membrane protein
LSEILLSAEASFNAEKPAEIQSVLPRPEEWKPSMKAIGRGTIIGFLIGLIPGTNSVIPAILSYAAEKKLSKDPSRFGKGINYYPAYYKISLNFYLSNGFLISKNYF